MHFIIAIFTPITREVAHCHVNGDIAVAIAGHDAPRGRRKKEGKKLCRKIKEEGE